MRQEKKKKKSFFVWFMIDQINKCDERIEMNDRFLIKETQRDGNGDSMLFAREFEIIGRIGEQISHMSDINIDLRGIENYCLST